MARGGQIIDASIVPVPTQRNSRDENANPTLNLCLISPYFLSYWQGQDLSEKPPDD